MSFFRVGGRVGRGGGPKPRSQSQTDQTSRGHLGSDTSNKNNPTKHQPQTNPASTKPGLRKSQTSKSPGLETNPPHTKNRLHNKPASHKTRLKQQQPHKTPAPNKNQPHNTPASNRPASKIKHRVYQQERLRLRPASYCRRRAWVSQLVFSKC